MDECASREGLTRRAAAHSRLKDTYRLTAGHVQLYQGRSAGRSYPNIQDTRDQTVSDVCVYASALSYHIPSTWGCRGRRRGLRGEPELVAELLIPLRSPTSDGTLLGSPRLRRPQIDDWATVLLLARYPDKARVQPSTCVHMRACVKCSCHATIGLLHVHARGDIVSAQPGQ